MPTLEIEGKRVAVDDSFLRLSQEEQNRTVEEIAGKLGVSREASPVGATDVVRAAATGVPILGGALNQANALTNAALAPVLNPLFAEKDQLKGSFAERRVESLRQQNAMDQRFATEHPITDTVAKVAGGVGATIPLVMAAPALMGAAGTVPQMVRAGAASGGAIGAADAAVRGDDVLHGGVIGGAVGAVAPIAGQAIGSVVRAFKGKPAPVTVPEQTIKVGTVDVPISQSQLTGDAAQSAEEQILARGGRGERAQGVAQDFEQRQTAAINQASDEIAANLDPSRASARTVPQAAGERVINELTDAELTRIATDNARRARVAGQGEQLRTQVGGPGAIDPATGAPAIVAESPFAAAEAVGAGVTRARDAAVQRTRDLYGRVRDEPGTFDPSVPRGLAEDIRARLNTGPEPLWVDPQTTSKANEALRVIDQTVGRGLFHNAAAGAPPAPVGPVAAAAAPPVQTEAEKALAELVAQGINPAKARAAVADLPGGGTLRAGALEPHDVAVPSGKTVRVEPKVLEASDIRTSADVGYDKSLQPRDRARAASGAQINDMARNLNPQRLGVSAEADRGAPIIGPDRLAESGNGRVLAIRQAYAENGEAAAKYRAWLGQQGVDVSKYREPILVRERVTPMSPAERKAFTVEANQSATLNLSAPERALADARSLTPDNLTLIRNPGDLGSAENRDFVRAFMQGVPASERGALMTAGGDLSSEGLSRVRNAVLAKAYGDTPILARIAESTADEIKSISNALVQAAPEWATLKGAISAGRVPAELDATADLLDAVNRTARIRGQGVGLEASQAQADAFSQQTPESKIFQRFFYDADGAKAAPAGQVSSALRNYAQEAAKVDAAPGLNLGLAPVTARDILETTAAKVGAPKELAKEVTEKVAAAAAPPATVEPISDIGLKEMDAARKRLVTMYSDARGASIRTGDRSDVRAMARILHEFDNAIIDAFEGGRFSGDSNTARTLLRDARASHSAYRQTFTSRGGSDPIGRDVEKILGRYTDTAATPDEIARLSYGSLAEPGGGQSMRVAQRLRSILGETSPEWGAYKQGLVSHLIDAPAEGAARSPVQTADRIDKFLTGTKGRGLAQAVFSTDERAAIKGYADNLRTTEPVKLADLNSVEKVIARISGRDGGLPATPGEVVDLLYSRTGKGDKGISVGVAQQLKRDLSPEGWTAVRQGMWAKLIGAGEGKIEFGPQALSQRLHEFLNESGSGLAKTLFSEAERSQMAVLAKAYKQMIPVKGTTNPSGTAPMLAKIANKASSNLLAMLGAASHGFPGLAVGYGVQKGLARYSDAKGAKAAVRSFYGPQPKLPPVRSSKSAIVLSQGGQSGQR